MRTTSGGVRWGMQPTNAAKPPLTGAGEYRQSVFEFQGLYQRRVQADFGGGHLSSDGGALWLRQIDEQLGLSRQLAGCFRDHRHQDYVEHSVRELLAQRLIGIALGYEDLNDHQQLRRDPLLAVAVGKADPLGLDRRLKRDQGRALAGASTLNRLELGHQGLEGITHFRKIVPEAARIEALLLGLGVQTLSPDCRLVVLDFDATDDPLHGHQEGKFFHGYYDNYCYLPLFCFAGEVPLWAQLRTSDRDGCDGTVQALEKIVPALRQRCPQARIIVRGDSGFARESIMAWCEQQGVSYCLGLARNSRLEKLLEQALAAAREKRILSGGATARHFAELEYRTHKSWSRARRVVGKAEVSAKGNNPRFIVTNLPLGGLEALRPEDHPGRFEEARRLYEAFYCERGEAENQIKQMMLDLQADRLSTHWMASNQMRLWLHSFAYLLMERLRHKGLQGTSLARATLGQVRLKVLKVAAWVGVSVRRVWVRLCSAYPWQDLWAQMHRQLCPASG